MSRPTILVVDDELFFRRLCSDALAEEGLYQIETADSGEAALERLNRGQGEIDVLLTDMVMPGICGLELIRRARLLPSPPEVILTTGNATIESAIQALKNGAREYLLKPCNPEQLRHVVRTCIEQRRLLAENSNLRSQILLYQKGQQLAALLDVDLLLKETLDALVQELDPASRALTFLVNQDNQPRIVASFGLEDNLAQAVVEMLLPQFADIGKGELLPSPRIKTVAACGADIGSLWVFPLQSDNGMQGAFVIINRPDGAFPVPFPHDSLVFLAEQATLGFQNACQYQGARELIYTDDLTGLYNHRYLHTALEQEVRRSERYGLEFSVAFIDLDLLKRVNDTYGHLAGSSVLREVGTLLRRCVRDADLLFRYGGDEFTALLVETDIRGARVVAERIRQRVEAHTFKIGEELTCKLTATVGYATFPVHAKSKQELIDLADRAMYQAKQMRNATCSAADIRS